MTAKIDVTGERYGRLTAIERLNVVGQRSPWRFQCDCGDVVILPLERVRQGIAKSCGCLRKDVTRARSLTHGHRVNRKTTRTRKAYEHAKSRCFNPRNKKFPQYGGRGITMCDEWMGDFSNFLRDMGECPLGLSLDRVNVNGHYEPRNCRWATNSQQARARTDNVLVNHNGVEVVLKDYARIRGVNYKSLHALVRYRGMTANDAANRLLAVMDHP